MSKFRHMANTRGHFMLYIRLLYIHMLWNAYKRDCLGLLWQTISMYRMCYIWICLYIHCVRHVHHCLKVKIILTMATGGMVVFQFNELIWNFVRRYVRGFCMGRCSSLTFRCSVGKLWLSTISKTRKTWFRSWTNLDHELGTRNITHWAPVTHICVSKTYQHWFR